MRRILLACPKGGVGKSCLARNLSSASAHEGLSTSICDLDVQETSHRWGLRRGVRTDLPRVSLIGHDDEVGGPLKAPTWDDLDLLLTNFASYDLLFLDSPPSVEAQPESFRTLLHRVDLVVVPCTPTFDDAESVAPFVQYLGTEGIAALVVLNKVKPRVNNGPIKAYLLEHGADLCAAEVSDRTDFHRTAAQGLAMPDFPGHAGADEIRGVWAVIRQRLGMGSRMQSASRAGSGRRVRA